ncbi:hypothetical protein ANCDUO_16030 [Ancylostoma duodenale]|uniref:glucuronosyltransferase n=1 Tax=Ancylostoma duodenale TaxID=51022 RepID=A0A0C2FYX9_9BILA|nr:hypothetical protein ANCDUO_16030 [Ancylostoma duodenale]
MFKPELLLLFCLQLADSYKILVYSAPLGYSHIQFMGRIADILQEAGHDVILHELPEDLKNKMRPKSFNLWSRGSTSLFTHLSFVDTFTEHQAEACDLLLSDNRTMGILRKERFDVGITETIGACGFGLFEASTQFCYMKVLRTTEEKRFDRRKFVEFSISHFFLRVFFLEISTSE